ncbi:MAG TPA: MlaD family protein [Solirubrobacterales bacterium]|nr:MlaD family protein [Solirubrobacterales bacterium]
MSDGNGQVSRVRHFRAWLGRQTRGRGRDTIAIFVLAVVAIVMTLWIFTQQKAALPSWAPLVGEDFVPLSADFTSAQAVTPGQGQAVVIAGVRIGKVSSVDVDEGHAVVGMDVEPQYLELIHPDATLLLRPKTNLNDMVVEIDPGTARGHVEEGHHFPLSRTEPNVNFEAFLSILDEDTRRYLQLLVAGGAQGIGGRGMQLSGAFRRLGSFSRIVADLNQAVAGRRQALAQVIHDFGLLTNELGRRDAQLERFVTSSKDVLGNFANQQAAIQESLIEFPATLAALQSGLRSSTRFSEAARPALLRLIPQARALGPAFDAQKRLFAQTRIPLRDQIRPFTRQILPVLRHVKQGSADLDTSVTGFGNALHGFNSFLNELAFKPKGSRQSYLFYLPWLSHNANASFNLQDAGGPIQRTQLLITCNGSFLAYGISASGQKPYVTTVLEGARLPRPTDLPFIPADREAELQGVPGCGPQVAK